MHITMNGTQHVKSVVMMMAILWFIRLFRSAICRLLFELAKLLEERRDSMPMKR